MKDRFRNISIMLVLMMCIVAFAPAEIATSAPDAQVEMVVDMKLTENVQTHVVQSGSELPESTFLHISAPEEPVIIDKHYLQAEELNYKQIAELIYQEPYLTMDKWRFRTRLI